MAECDSWVFRTDRDEARERGTKYTEARGRVEPYTDEQLAEFYKLYEAEEIRGATPRYWEDVKEGEALPRMMKGPMTVTGFICYAQGWGGLYIRANKLAWQDAVEASGPRHQESLQRARLSGARSLGRSIRARSRRAGRL